MVFFYEREGAFLRCEARTAENGPGFELVIQQPDGSEKIEYFDDSAALTLRQKALEAELESDGWTGPFGRTI